MAEGFRKGMFDDHVGSTFVVRTESAGEVKVELMKATDRSGGNLESFSALFRGAEDKPFDQGTYKVNHDKLGEMEVFLTRVISPEDDEKHPYYELIVTRLKE